jgi:CDP-diacylglycerol pyrophosphatase
MYEAFPLFPIHIHCVVLKTQSQLLLTLWETLVEWSSLFVTQRNGMSMHLSLTTASCDLKGLLLKVELQ